jgi:ferric-dicitrate binding protein FerR (iron transport regulator)
VTISGEAYFAVSHNAKIPFKVIANGAEIQDIGTEFNVSAYGDEPETKTTLVEGSVRVRSGVDSRESIVIKPGQQAILSANLQLTTSNQVDLDEVTAWKNGLFHFESADVKTILRQFARWYDVEVIYEGELSTRKFFGIVNRDTPLSNVLQILKANDIKFRIEGKKLYVVSG